MTIYVISNVRAKEHEYVDYLMKCCVYKSVEAETRYWEIECQIIHRCNPILMKPGSSGTIKFKSVLQRQEIERFANNRSELLRIIKRIRGKRGNTQWNVGYIVSNQGNVYITAINFYNSIYENTFFKTNLLIKESQLCSIIRETIRRLLNA